MQEARTAPRCKGEDGRFLKILVYGFCPAIINNYLTAQLNTKLFRCLITAHMYNEILH